MNKKFSIKDALQYGYETTRAHLKFLGVVTAITLFVNIGTRTLTHFVVNYLFELQSPEMLWTVKEVVFLLIPQYIAYYIVVLFVPLFFNLGYLKVGLELFDQKKSDYAAFYSCAHLLLRAFWASFVYWLLIFIGAFPALALGPLAIKSVLWESIAYRILISSGLFLCAFLSIYAAITYLFYMLFIVDKNMDINNAFKRSAVITKGNKLQVFFFCLVVGGIEVLGALLLGVGLLFTTPIVLLATIYVYRKLSENPRLDDPRIS